MNPNPLNLWSLAGASLAAAIGGSFFFLIIGVFGLVQAIGSLGVFIVVALFVFRVAQTGDDAS